MKRLAVEDIRLVSMYLLVVAFACAPVWWVDYFVNQDGSAHLHTAYLMSEVVKGSDFFTNIYALNSFAVPNSSGHWILAALCQVLSPFVVTKVIVTITFAGIVFAAAWLRLATVGRRGVETSILLGAAVAFNWLWLVGFYNFTLGVVVTVLTLGAFYKYRERFGFAGAVLLSVALVFVYLSHAVSFLVLSGGIAIVAVFTTPGPTIRRAVWTLSAFVPVIPFLVGFRFLNSSGEAFSPVWRNVDLQRPLQSWLFQLRSMDPFILISRKAFPFVEMNSDAFAVFTPLLWIMVALGCLTWASVRHYRADFSLFRAYLPFFLLAGGSLLLAAFGPDDFNLTNGGVLRERFFITGVLFLIPLYRSDSRAVNGTANIILTCVLIFQTTVLWDYALSTNNKMSMFQPASEILRQSPSSAMIVIEPEPPRFHADPLSQVNCYSGIGNENLVWDNYELGHYLFPLVTRSAADKRFIFNLTRSEHFPLAGLNEPFAEKLERLDAVLAEFNGRIDTIAIAGSDGRIEAIVSKWFEEKPYYQNGPYRLFRHR